MKLYYHLLTKEQAEEALKLPNHIFQRELKRPQGCNFSGALDKELGCPFLFRSEKDRTHINNQCKACPCRKESL